jgi:aldehyde:ferredoxin oxidoreductase
MPNLTKYFGYAGQILRINLTNHTTNIETVDDELCENFLGGEGFGSKILWDELEPGIDSFDPRNQIVFTVGPIQGTVCPSVSRACVSTKSPLTNGITRSLCGGNIGYELKRAGFDILIVEGRATCPVYVWINNSDVEIRDAANIWGAFTGKAQEIIKNCTDEKSEVMCIGPAGEKLVRSASIISGIGAFGRGGTGAVLGSKKLKAIAVHGTRAVRTAEPSMFEDAVRNVYATFADHKPLAQSWRLYGSASMIDIVNEMGNFPFKNWQGGHQPEAPATLYSVPWRKSVVKKDLSCKICPVCCRKVTASTHCIEGARGVSFDTTSVGPEYETLWAFGAECGNHDAETITACDRLCDEYGMDTISVGSSIGFAMELYQRGIVSKEDLGGFDLAWGDCNSITELIKKIGSRSGFGDILAEGTKRASEKIGKSAERYAMQVKGLELPAYDPRGQKGMGLNYATANRGGCHETGYTTYDEVYGPKPVDRFSEEGKPKLVKRLQDDTCYCNSAIICLFGPIDVRWQGEPMIDKLLTAATGYTFNYQTLKTIGERIYNIERAFNIREGFDNRTDTLPERLLTEELHEGPSLGHIVKLEPMLREYYETRGWNSNGVPTREKLRELGLGYVADEIAQ